MPAPPYFEATTRSASSSAQPSASRKRNARRRAQAKKANALGMSSHQYPKQQQPEPMDAEPTVNAQDGTEVEEKSNVAVTAEQLALLDETDAHSTPPPPYTAVEPVWERAGSPESTGVGIERPAADPIPLASPDSALAVKTEQPSSSTPVQPAGRTKDESGFVVTFVSTTTYPPLAIEAEVDGTGEGVDSRHRSWVRLVDWKVPYRRLLQTLAVVCHMSSLAVAFACTFFFCGVPIFWPVVIPYLLHLAMSSRSTDGTLRGRSEWFRRCAMWRHFADYFPVRLYKTHDLLPTRKYILGYHPHGIISHGAVAALATEGAGWSEKFPGITNSLCTLDVNFRIPLLRDYALAMGLQSVSSESIHNILTKGGLNGEGMGRSVTIVLGGARESLEAKPGRMKLYLSQRKGFIRQAIRTGADLVPVIGFGENDLYNQAEQERHPWMHFFQNAMLKMVRFTLPALRGRGIFNDDFGTLPYRHPVHVVVGKPIPVVQKKEDAIRDDYVDQLHMEYVAEVVRLWDAYKDVFAKDRIAEMRIV